MAKETLNELALRLKKLAKTGKQYTDDLIAAALAAAKVELIEQGTAETGYLKTYILARGTKQEANVTNDNLIGKINIPKDFLVKSGEVKTATSTDVTNAIYTGVTAGDKYLDFIVNTIGGDGTDTHIYIPVKDLVDVYTGSAAITVGNDNSISLKIVAANGLSIDNSNGLTLAESTTSTAGAQSATGKTLETNIAKDFTLMTDAEILSWYGYNPSNMTTANTSEKALADIFGASGFSDSLTNQS